jgi:hypothetical protein
MKQLAAFVAIVLLVSAMLTVCGCSPSVLQDAAVDGGTCEDERDRLCALEHAECGVLIDYACDGRLWDCGRCKFGSTCGDNDDHYGCGRDCDGANYARACAEAGAPSAYGVSTACVASPYRKLTSAVVPRPQGRDGCTIVNGLVCCGL